MKKTAIITACILCLLFTGLFAGALPVAAATSITASSGSASSIQSAINTVRSAGGGTVNIPSGTFNLGGSVTVPSNIALIGAGTGTTILRTSGTSQIVNVAGDNTRVSGFSLISTNYDGARGIFVNNSIDFRVDNCHIEGYSHAGVFVDGRSTRGVIDHCTIKMKIMNDLGYGVVVVRDDYWEEDPKLGSSQATFIEDCTIINARHAVAANSGAHYVFRYNHVIEGVVGQQVDAHGIGNGSTVGTRAVEVYNNVIENPVSGTNSAVGLRGGAGVIFDNVFRGYTYGVILMVESDQVGLPYPVPQQIHDMYIWNNSYSNRGVVVASSPNSTNLIKENRDYFLYAKPGYTPYTYPHPLTLQSNLNRAPVLSSIGDRSVDCGSNLSLAVSATDPDGDKLVYSASGLPAGSSFNATNRAFSWTPSSSQSGTYKITFQVSDGSLTDSETITITVNAVAQPVKLPIRVNAGGGAFTDVYGNAWLPDQPFDGSWGFFGGDYSVNRGSIAIGNTADDYIYQTERWNLQGYRFVLPDGNYDVILHFAETYAEGINRRVFDVSVQDKTILDNLDIFAEAGMNNALVKKIGNISVTGGLLTISISENIPASALNGVEIIKAQVNRAPVLSSIGDRSVDCGSNLSLAVSATDPDGDKLVYSASGLPAGSSFNATNRAFSWTPSSSQSGTYKITFQVSDGSLTDSETITITVNAVAQPVKLPIRVNAGGGAFTDVYGNAWLPDQPFDGSWGFFGGDYSVNRGSIAIGNTADDYIYQTERWNLQGYRFVLPDGNYDVILHFAETYAEGINRRVFDVSVQDKTILDNLDIFAEAGMNNALVKKIANVSVTGGLLTISISENIPASALNGVEVFSKN